MKHQNSRLLIIRIFISAFHSENCSSQELVYQTAILNGPPQTAMFPNETYAAFAAGSLVSFRDEEGHRQVRVP